MKYTAAILLIAAGACFQGCNTSNGKAKSEGIDTKAVNPATDVAILQKGQLGTSLKIPGELIANQEVDLYAKVNGFVKKLYVDVGSSVKAGQLIATLEAPELNAQVSGAQSRIASQEAAYQSSKATYDRLVATSKTPGTVSQNELDVAAARQKSDYAQWQSAKASYTEVGVNRGYLEIRAPFSGVITKRNVSAGAYVGPSGKGSELPMFTLQEIDRLRLRVSVPENYQGHLEIGMPVSFTTKSVLNRTFTGKVSRLAGALDTRYRAQPIEIDINNSDRALMPGMVTETMLKSGAGQEGYVAPSAAVLNATTGIFVIKIAKGKAEWVPVHSGVVEEDKTMVFGEGLAPGDTIAALATEELRNGQPVQDVTISKD